MINPIGAVINFIVGVVDVLLTLRLLAKFFGIPPSSSFIAWLYNFTQPLISPFVGIFPSFSLANFLIESPTIVALLIVGIIGYLLGSVFFFPRRYDYY